jgi:trk system potassium uptake protein
MKKIAVIGLNNFGLSVARELSLSGSSVTVIDMDKAKINKITPFIDEANVITDVDITKLKSINFDRFDTVILFMSGQTALVLASLIFLRKINQNKVIICVENEEEAMIADLFSDENGWDKFRLDRFAYLGVNDLIQNHDE